MRVCRGVTAGVLAAALMLAPSSPAWSQVSKKDPRRAAAASAPLVRATRPVTNFSDALSCMDELLLRYGKRDITVFSNDLPDATGTINVGAREMLISALDTMSLKSGAFRYVDASFSDGDVGIEQMRINAGGKIPSVPYYVKGGITQVDTGVLTKSKRAGLAFDFLSIGAGSDQTISNVAIELGIYETRDRTQIRGVRSSNMMQIVRSGSGVDLGGLLPFASILFEVSNDRAQGSHQTVRTLIELSAIELMGKLTRVPYWQCLSLPSTDPAARQAAEEYFARMKPAEQIAATQTALAGARYYTGDYDGSMSPELAQAITRYRVAENLAPGPHIDFDLYFHFLVRNLVADGERAGRRPATPALAAKPLDDSIDFALRTHDTVEQGAALVLELVSNKDAYFYCFMAAGNGKVVRIYPNRWTGNQPLTPAGESLQIPGADGAFAIRLNDVGAEEIACVARERPFDIEPKLVSLPALAPITVPYPRGALQGTINEFQKADPAGLQSTVRISKVQVIPRAMGTQ